MSKALNFRLKSMAIKLVYNNKFNSTINLININKLIKKVKLVLIKLILIFVKINLSKMVVYWIINIIKVKTTLIKTNYMTNNKNFIVLKIMILNHNIISIIKIVRIIMNFLNFTMKQIIIMIYNKTTILILIHHKTNIFQIILIILISNKMLIMISIIKDI